MTHLSPKQQEMLDEVLAVGAPRPDFEPAVAERLLDRLRLGLAPLLGNMGPDDRLAISAYELRELESCERRWTASDWGGWSIDTLRGRVAHRAIERLVMTDEFDKHQAFAPLDLVEYALGRLVDDDKPRGAADFINGLLPEEREELVRDATDAATKYQANWPPLSRRWKPRVESSRWFDVFDGEDRICLHARYDLALGTPAGTQARCLIVDLKTGGAYPEHFEQVRFYALVETLAAGIPPFRVAIHYLDSGQTRVEDVSEDGLRETAERVLRAVAQMRAIRTEEVEPTTSPSPLCAYCNVYSLCSDGQEFIEQRGVA